MKWFTVADFLYARSYVYHYRGKRGRFVTVLWFRDFLARPILPINRCQFMEKRGRQIFLKIVRASKLTRQRTLEINNAHLDRSRCWQHLQEATKKTFSFTVSWQKQIKCFEILWNFKRKVSERNENESRWPFSGLLYAIWRSRTRKFCSFVLVSSHTYWFSSVTCG